MRTTTRLASSFAFSVLLGAFGCAGDPAPPGKSAGNGGSGNSGGAGGSGPGGSTNGGSGSGVGGAMGGGGMPAVDFGTPAGTVETDPVACMGTTDSGAITFEKIAVWRDDATAAYTMVHDDMCGPQLRGIDRYAMPVLEMRNLRATMGPFVEVCEEFKLWDMVKEAQMKGHEIGNHSFSHPNIRMENAGREVMMAKMVFDTMLPKPVTFYIFPYDDFSPETIALVKMAGHIGARAGNRDDNDGFELPPINPAEPTNDMELEFDAWPRAYSKYASFHEDHILDLHVHNAIEKGGFAVREFHSITPMEKAPLAGEGFGPVPLRKYEAHLDFLVNAWKSNKVWTSTASTIIKYRQARMACQASVSGNKITFTTTNPLCTQYATPISVIVTTANDVPGLKATQGGNPVSTRKLAANRFSVTADPTGGDVDIEGCMTPSPAVDTSIMLPAKPQPAASVCDLESAKGDGSDGQMDNLDRPNGQLQVLPNPAQKDNRTGSWSWYPQTATAAIEVEGMNGFLRYTGQMLGAWSGATLAFMGGNGAGTCYDASAYTGVKFKIKGTVTATDALLNGKVVVSLVTAETQTRKYGGDLMGEGGHFNAIVQVTPEWTEVTLPWAMFGKPTWGPSAAFTQVALTKLQAIDWGVSDTATSFDISIDDISLTK